MAVVYDYYQTWPLETQKESTTTPPNPRGDASGPGVDEVQFLTHTQKTKWRLWEN